MTTKVAAAYARYSSDLQDPSSIDDQLALAERWADRHGHSVAGAHRFSDYAKSGGSVHLRDGFNAMMEAAHRKEFSILIVENLSRLSRNFGDIGRAIDTFEFLGISVVEAATGTVLDQMSAAMKGIVAHITRDQTAQMVRRGLDAVVRSGQSAGGRAYGYRSLPRTPQDRRGGALEIIPSEGQIVYEIFDRYAAGETPRAIAADLNRRGVKAPRGSRWGSSCIHGEVARGSGILNNELYRGWRVWNKSKMVKNPATGKRVSRRNPASEHVRIEAKALRIIPESLWDAVAVKKARIAAEPPQRARAAQRVFSGLLRCGACGAGMSSKGKDLKTGRVRISCTRGKESGDCPDARSYNVDEIEGRVLALLRDELQEPDVIRDFLATYEAEMKRLRLTSTSRRSAIEGELVKVSASATRMNDLLMQGLGDPARTDALLQPLLLRENELRQQLAAVATPSVVVLHPAARDRYLDAVARLHETLGDDGESEPAKVIREVIETVVLHPVGVSRNRHTAPPKIEIVGRLEALIGQRFLIPIAVGGIGGSGGGT